MRSSPRIVSSNTDAVAAVAVEQREQLSERTFQRYEYGCEPPGRSFATAQICTFCAQRPPVRRRKTRRGAPEVGIRRSDAGGATVDPPQLTEAPPIQRARPVARRLEHRRPTGRRITGLPFCPPFSALHRMPVPGRLAARQTRWLGGSRPFGRAHSRDVFCALSEIGAGTFTRRPHDSSVDNVRDADVELLLAFGSLGVGSMQDADLVRKTGSKRRW